VTRRQVWRWLGWFIAANAGLCFLIGLRYLLVYHWPDSAAGMVYPPLAMLGNFALVTAFFMAVPCVPLLVIGPLRRSVMTVAVIVAALMLALLVLDTNFYAERHIHLSLLVAVLFEPATWIAGALVLAIALLFEAVFAGMLWRWLAARARRGGRGIAIALVACWVLSQGMHIWADAVGYGAITRFTEAIPLYYPQTAKRALARLGLVDPERVRQARLMRRATHEEDGELHYPLAPLQCEAATQPLNVLWIVIDGLRPDAPDAALTPALIAFREQSQVFEDHWSAGNSSRMGAFAMFYGLPSTYFQSFYAAERPPVLMDQFRNTGYELFAADAVGFGSPTQMDRTVLAGVPDLRSGAGLGRVGGNRKATREFVQWIGDRPGDKPFFAMLWYNHSDLDIGEAGPAVAPDGRYAANPLAAARWLRYRRGLAVIDDEVAKALGALDRAGGAGETLVLVMGDHGFEFDDLGLGYYGHASNYARYQLQTPLWMRWPGREPRRYAHRSSHLDLPATLLQELFGCRNPPADYGVGHNLFEGRSWEWMIAGSYHSYAIVEPDRILVVRPGGLAEVLDSGYRLTGDATLDARLIGQAIDEMRRYYR
jgi:membrane-anchored protein YejM (alkaline phosphatase superfamily)